MLVFAALAALMWALTFVLTALFFLPGVRDPFRNAWVVGWMFACGILGAAVFSIVGLAVASSLWLIPHLIFHLPQGVAITTLITGASIGGVLGFVFGAIQALTMAAPDTLAKIPAWLAKRLD